MDRPWDLAYREHAIWGTLEKAQASLAEVDMPISDPRSVALQALLATIDARRDKPEILITQASLDSVEGYLQELIVALPGNLDAILDSPNGVFERLASTIRTWPATASVNLMGLSSRVDELNRIFAASEEAILAKVDETIDTQTRRVSRELSAIANNVTEYRSQMEARWEQDVKKANVARDKIDEDLALAANDVSAANVAATNLMERISAQDIRLDEASTERAEKFAAETTTRQSEWESIKSDIYADIAASRESMAEAERDSRNVLANIGVNVTAGDYGAYAALQEQAADRWRMAATAAFSLAGIVFIAFALGPLLFGNLKLEWWEYAFQRLGTPLGIAGVAVYMARESGLHREQQRIAKQAHLTLGALEPFIANLPAQEKSAIRSETARKLFANSEDFAVAKEGSKAGKAPGALGRGSDA